MRSAFAVAGTAFTTFEFRDRVSSRCHRGETAGGGTANVTHAYCGEVLRRA